MALDDLQSRELIRNLQYIVVDLQQNDDTCYG